MMSQQFGPSPLESVWLEVVAMQAQDAFIDAMLRHYQMPSIQKRLIELKYDLPMPVDIKPIRYELSDLRLE